MNGVWSKRLVCHGRHCSRRFFHPAPLRLHGGGGHAHGRDTHGIEDADLARQARRVTLMGGGVNLALTAGTGVVGYLSGSSSLVAHAIHSLSDLVSDAVAVVSLKMASSQPDDIHPYG